MTLTISPVQNGTVTSAQGFSAGATFAGIKTPGELKRDIGLLFSDRPADVAGTFSQNSVVSPSVTLTRETVRSGNTVRGLVANSGCANCAVGEQGLTDAREVTEITAARLGVAASEMLIASTGIIGVELPMALMRDHIPQIKLSDRGGGEFALSILTTDTRTKEHAVSFVADGRQITVGGVAKGSGMIHPNMATMLAFMTTDAEVDPGFLQRIFSDAVNVTFNQIDVDGDQSTNDTVLLLANGAAGNPRLTGDDEASDAFVEAVNQVSRYLARELARDGEGAQHLIEVSVEGAASDEEALAAARSVASSMLVKTAVYGRDPNWGRIIMAV